MDCIGDDNIVAYGLNVEGHKIPLQTLVHEGMLRELGIERIVAGVVLGLGYKVKWAVINIHPALGEIRCVEILLAVNESAGQAGVTRAFGSFDHGHNLRRWPCSSLS